ncbi:helix-turn-helix transcriptional regulator [Agromyces humatus]|uniref:Helix-turn-helix domain-containing protein n=1 Tax=Agromyces humatus TaxID=279573 RepID=A0ABP4X1H8_9MICO|nr:helix-turn-helix domain-containing protein [Agromyces humatus]
MRSAATDEVPPRGGHGEPASLALLSSARRRVLAALREVSAPVDAAALAEALGVHVTTARFHLDQLVEAGVVAATAERTARRGRPRLRYALVADADPRARDERARDRLIEVLAETLEAQGADAGRSLARSAGRRWAASLEAHEADPPVRLTRILDELGFAPEATPEGIALHACPFRESARAHRNIVCSVHDGLIREVLAGEASDANHPPIEARLMPFVTPERCLVALSARR